MPKTIMQKNRTFLSDIIVDTGFGILEVAEKIAPHMGVSKQAVYQRIIGKTPGTYEEIQQLTDLIAQAIGKDIPKDARSYDAVLVKVV